MAERTITLSSLGKTFSMTGWKIGWAVAPPELTRAVRSAHQFLTFATSTPFQHAAAAALTHGEDYIAQLVEQYRSARDFLSGALEALGLTVHPSDGTYFIMADHSRFGFRDDVAFCMHLTEKVGVAAIPPSAFYSRPELGQTLARFAFCKRRETLERAVERLHKLRR
jgi:aspartate/methionine/tyrosine aminotransferase